jgi:23S rRNA pseudouridine1911/1915/1917 synthase
MEPLVISEKQAGLRLDVILADHFSHIKSRSYFQYLFEEKKVLLNGASVKKRHRPKAFDEVEVEFILTEELSLEPENIPLDILFEDEAIIVINKPAGLVVHPAAGNWTGTLVNGLLYHCQNLGVNDLRPGIVHRLDKDTSGVLVAAKTDLAKAKLIESFSKREVQKEYVAICQGNPGKKVIDQPIGRHPKKRKEMCVIEGGKPAVSHIETLHFDGKLSVVRIKPVTGRTHQIRVHLKHLGTPVLGDAVYGHKDLGRQRLHAQKLTFPHPVTLETLTFEAPLPEDMEKCDLLSNA